MGRHPAVYLMGRDPIPRRLGFARGAMRPPGASGITPGFPELSPGAGQVGHVLLSRSPLASPRRGVPFDLHVLGAPPAFILSQDRTLRSNARRREPPYSVSGRSVPSIDPADLGFAEIDVSDVASEFEISLVCHVDLSIAVSGSQGTPRRSWAVGSSPRGE